MKEVKKEIESKLDIDITEILFGTPKGILEKYQNKEKSQSNEDQIFHEASHLKNSLEQYIYDTREKLGTQLQGFYTDKEKTDLTKYMDELMAFLYQEDESIYDKQTLLKNSKNMKDLGDAIYKRCNDWNKLISNYSIFESEVNDLTTQVKNEEEKLNKKQYVYVTAEDVEKIHGLINDAIANAKKKHDLTDKAPKINYPPVMPDEVDMLTKNLKENVKKIYDDAEFKVKEEERKRKEEEEKNKEESFAESFENHKLLWIGLFTFILTTVLGIIGMVLLAVKIKKLNPDAGRATIVAKEAEMKNLGSKLITQSEAV